MKKNICTLFALFTILLVGCDDVLDRPQLNKPVDNNYWRNETDVRLYANEFYANFFVGYNSTWGTAYTPVRGYIFGDDFAKIDKQTSFENSVPATRGSTSDAVAMLLAEYAGPNWNFLWVRKANILLDRLETVAKPNLTEEQLRHWTGVAHFFKGFEYCRLVSVFGDVPYFEKDFSDEDKDIMFKDRDTREVVMDSVYDLFKSSMEKLRVNDGGIYLNRYMAAAFISRFMLFEGTWQKYHKNNQTHAKKYLDFAVEAAEYVMNSGLYEIDGSFKTLFGSQNLSGNKEMVLYRKYDADKSVTHHIASYCNGYEPQDVGATLDLAKSFLCLDGKPYTTSSIPNAALLTIANVTETRDPRFEATFFDEPKRESPTLLYTWKFIDRVGPTYAYTGNIPSMYGSFTNTNDAPVIRYGEVLLNWIEAKAELATMGGNAVTQADINKSINQLRSRELDEVALAKGLYQTASMNLSDITENFDPNRDADVSPLIWEIRRERRMELAYEFPRILDIKRWKKLGYMDNEKNPDTMVGLWINLKEELPTYLDPDADGNYTARQVMKEDGTIVTYDGTNADQMVGYYIPRGAEPRDPFTDRSYCAPVGKAQVDQYAERGYKLTQTDGW